MSAVSSDRGRTAPTTPPPPMVSQSAGMRARAEELRAFAIKILCRAEELEESAERIEGSTDR